MSETATPVYLGTIGVHYVEGQVTPEAVAEVEGLGYTAVWIAGTRGAGLTIVEAAHGDRDARRRHRCREYLVGRCASRR